MSREGQSPHPNSLRKDASVWNLLMSVRMTLLDLLSGSDIGPFS